EKDRFAQRWANGTLRTPRIVEIADTARGPYGISERVAGGPLDDLDEMGLGRVLPSLLSAMDAMRDADLSGTRGYGLWHGDGNAPHASWRDNLVGEDAPGERAKQRDALAGSRVGSREFDIGLERMHELLSFCPEDRHLVHNDLLNFNVFVDASGVVLLDWGASIYGDFLYEVALLTFWWPWFQKKWRGIDIRYEIERHYMAIGLAIPNYAERLRCCELDIGISHIAFQVSRGELANAAWTARRVTKLAATPLSDSS
ncbi:MAG: phosphotransferase, partial [Chloroflexota bacterium]|nr:phosphotransferase [Chloroflexota bacterium]